ncbi:hypothetical protein ABBQ38_013282 [Trebouxia sp. C0009 RCD-2024]
MKGLRCNQVHSFEGHAPRNPDGLNNQPAASSRRNPSPGQLLRVLHNETSPSVMVQSTLSVHKRAQAARPRLRPVMQSLAQIADPGQDPGCNYGSWEFRPKLQAGQMRHNRIAHQNSDIQPDIQRNSIPWVSVHSKESFAVKKTSAEKYKQRPELYDNEVRALELLKQHQVARVVKLVDTLVAANGDRYLVLEFVKGLSLDRYLVAQSRLRYLSSAQEYEQGMLALGAQLTMEGMHSAGIAHMDLKPSNILMQPLTDSPAAIVIDFGSSQQISGGASIKPAAFSFAYAAPEVLDVMRLHFNPSFDRSTLVNGAAADAWSIGIIMFEAIASELPFTTQYNLPEHVSTESERVWQAFAEIRQPQQLWSDAVDAADGLTVHHPLIEKLKMTSTDPKYAIDFFMKLLHPDPEARMTMVEAARHPYMARAMQRLLTKDAHVGAGDHGHSTAVLPATLATSAQAHSTCWLANGKQSSRVMASTTAEAHAPGFEGMFHRLYPMWQLSRLPQALSMACNVLAGFLRHFSRARATSPSHTVSKQAIRRIMNLEADCSDGLVPLTQKRVSESASEPETDRHLTKAKGQHMSTTIPSACPSSSASSCTETGAAERESDSSASDVR